MDIAPANTQITKHSIVIAGHRTSISLEDAFWRALKDIAHDDGVSLAALVSRIDAEKSGANLSSALRVFVLQRAFRKHHKETSPSGGRIPASTACKAWKITKITTS